MPEINTLKDGLKPIVVPDQLTLIAHTNTNCGYIVRKLRNANL